MNMGKPLFVLASKSPRRKELLKNIGISAQIVPASIDESSVTYSSPREMVTRLAFMKATDVARSFSGNTYVIGADTVVSLDGKIFGKPRDIEDARRMLTALSGKTHSVYTGYCVVYPKSGAAISKCEETKVTFRPMSEDEIDAYIKTREPMDKAGAYGIQGKGSVFVEKIEGDYFNVVGLPVCALAKMLKDEFSVSLI